MRSWTSNGFAGTGGGWQTPGAQGGNDYDGAKPLGTITATATGTVSFDLNAAGRAVVQKWIDSPATNFGFIIQNYGSTTNDNLQIRPREASTTGNRPKLTINFAEASGQSTLSMGSLARAEGNGDAAAIAFAISLSGAAAGQVPAADSVATAAFASRVPALAPDVTIRDGGVNPVGNLLPTTANAAVADAAIASLDVSQPDAIPLVSPLKLGIRRTLLDDVTN